MKFVIVFISFLVCCSATMAQNTTALDSAVTNKTKVTTVNICDVLCTCENTTQVFTYSIDCGSIHRGIFNSLDIQYNLNSSYIENMQTIILSVDDNNLTKLIMDEDNSIIFNSITNLTLRHNNFTYITSHNFMLKPFINLTTIDFSYNKNLIYISFEISIHLNRLEHVTLIDTGLLFLEDIIIPNNYKTFFRVDSPNVILSAEFFNKIKNHTSIVLSNRIHIRAIKSFDVVQNYTYIQALYSLKHASDNTTKISPEFKKRCHSLFSLVHPLLEWEVKELVDTHVQTKALRILKFYDTTYRNSPIVKKFKYFKSKLCRTVNTLNSNYVLNVLNENNFMALIFHKVFSKSDNSINKILTTMPRNDYDEYNDDNNSDDLTSLLFEEKIEKNFTELINASTSQIEKNITKYLLKPEQQIQLLRLVKLYRLMVHPARKQFSPDNKLPLPTKFKRTYCVITLVIIVSVTLFCLLIFLYKFTQPYIYQRKLKNIKYEVSNLYEVPIRHLHSKSSANNIIEYPMSENYNSMSKNRLLTFKDDVKSDNKLGQLIQLLPLPSIPEDTYQIYNEIVVSNNEYKYNHAYTPIIYHNTEQDSTCERQGQQNLREWETRLTTPSSRYNIRRNQQLEKKFKFEPHLLHSRDVYNNNNANTNVRSPPIEQKYLLHNKPILSTYIPSSSSPSHPSSQKRKSRQRYRMIKNSRRHNIKVSRPSPLPKILEYPHELYQQQQYHHHQQQQLQQQFDICDKELKNQQIAEQQELIFHQQDQQQNELHQSEERWLTNESEKFSNEPIYQRCYEEFFDVSDDRVYNYSNINSSNFRNLANMTQLDNEILMESTNCKNHKILPIINHSQVHDEDIYVDMSSFSS